MSFHDVTGPNPKYGPNQFHNRGFMTKLTIPWCAKGNITSNTRLGNGANANFVWDRSIIDYHTPVLNSSAEICEGRSRIAGEGNVKFKVGSHTLSLKVKHTTNFSEKVVEISSIIDFFRVKFDKSGGNDFYILQGRETGSEVLKKQSMYGLYPFTSPLIHSSKENLSKEYIEASRASS